jgi:hypothetical protein
MIRDSRTITIKLILLLMLCPLTGCGFGPGRHKVHSIERSDVVYDVPLISDQEKFLNDLMLSPYWQVEKGRDGYFRARARAISTEFGSSSQQSGAMLLFEWGDSGLLEMPEGYRISNESMRRFDGYTTFSVEIIFGKPPQETGLNTYQPGAPLKLAVYESYDNQIGPNSYSTLLFELAASQDVYLLVREQGADLDRTTTFDQIPNILKEIDRLQALPATYSVKETYLNFFQLTFDSLAEDQMIKRLAGLQDRDTFFGYFKASEATSYAGVNLKISHPIFCNGECTRSSSRLKKAEYLGQHSQSDDLLFFQIEDNAVYLATEEYDQKYGTFSGDESFEGKLEIINEQGQVLYEAADDFKGWER